MEANKESIVLVVNDSDNFAVKSGNTYKSQRELVTDYWCKKKKEARKAGKDYTELDKQLDMEHAQLLYSFRGRYVIDAEGNINPLKNI